MRYLNFVAYLVHLLKAVARWSGAHRKGSFEVHATIPAHPPRLFTAYHTMRGTYRYIDGLGVVLGFWFDRYPFWLKVTTDKWLWDTFGYLPNVCVSFCCEIGILHNANCTALTIEWQASHGPLGSHTSSMLSISFPVYVDIYSISYYTVMHFKLKPEN